MFWLGSRRSHAGPWRCCAAAICCRHGAGIDKPAGRARNVISMRGQHAERGVARATDRGAGCAVTRLVGRGGERWGAAQHHDRPALLAALI